MQEKYINDMPEPITIEKTKLILEQMEKGVCSIITNKGETGTGFFCNIDYKNIKGNFLVTNYHVINNVKEDIKIIINDGKEPKKICFDKGRKIYLNEDYDVTMIELKEKDKINSPLYLDDNLFVKNSYINYERKSIYTLHCPKGGKISVSYGKSKDIIDYNLNHTCITEDGSSGSPILNLSNNKVIGIHKKATKYNFNVGTFLKAPIIDFQNKNKINEIGPKKKIKGNIGEKNYFLDISQKPNNIDEINNKTQNYFFNKIDYSFEKKVKDMLILVKTKKGKPFYIKTYPNETILEIKREIQQIEGIHPNQQRLLFDGEQLEDNRTIDFYGIESQDMIILDLRFRTLDNI